MVIHIILWILMGSSFVFYAMAPHPNKESTRDQKLMDYIEKYVAHEVDRTDNAILFEAILSENAQAVELLLKNGINCELRQPVPTMQGLCTPLTSAIRWNQKPIVTLLLKYGASVNTPDQKGFTPLACALDLNPNPTIVAYLLQEPSIDPEKLIPSAREGKAMMMPMLAIAKDVAHSYRARASIPRFNESAANARKIGRMLLTHLRFYSAQGRVSKTGLLPTSLPLAILKKIAASIDYEQAQKEYKP